MRIAVLSEGAIVVSHNDTQWLFGAPENVHLKLKEWGLVPKVVFTSNLKSPGIGHIPGPILSFKEQPLSMNGLSARPVFKKHGSDYVVESDQGKIFYSERGDVSVEDVKDFPLAIIKNKHRAEAFSSNVLTWPWPDTEYTLKDGSPLLIQEKVWSDVEDIPPALKGLGVSLEQANQIARIAEASVTEGKENWAIAISTFKKGHVKKDSGWVKREKEEGKVSKEEANYRETSAGSDNSKRCGNCAYYSDYSCSKVEGRIEPGMISDIYKPKEQVAEKEYVEGFGPVKRFGDIFISDIHTAYNDCCDKFFAEGYMNEAERIELAGAIGDALKKLRDVAPKEVMDRVVGESIPLTLKEFAPNIPDQLENGYWSTVYKDDTGQDKWASISSVAVQDRQKETFSTKAMDWALGFAKMVNFKGPLRYRHIPGLDGGDCTFQKRVGDFFFESGTFRPNKMGERLKELMSQPGMGVSLGLLFAKEDIVDGVYQRALIFERSLTPSPAVPYTTSLSIGKKEIEMNKLTDEQLQELATELKMDLVEVKTMYERATAAGSILGLKEFETALKETIGGANTGDDDEDEPKLSQKEMAEILEGLTVAEFKELEDIVELVENGEEYTTTSKEDMFSNVNKLTYGEFKQLKTLMSQVKAASDEEDAAEDEDEDEEEYKPMPMAKKGKKASVVVKKTKEDQILAAIKEQNNLLTQFVQATASSSGNSNVESALAKILSQVPRNQSNFLSKMKSDDTQQPLDVDSKVLAKLKEIEDKLAAQNQPASVYDQFTSTTLNGKK